MNELPRDMFAVMAEYWHCSSLSCLRCTCKTLLFLLDDDFVRYWITKRLQCLEVSQLWSLHWPGKTRVLYNEFIMVFSELLGLDTIKEEASQNYRIIKKFFMKPFEVSTWVDVDSLVLFLKWCSPLAFAPRYVKEFVESGCYCGVLGHMESVRFFTIAQAKSGMLLRLSPETGGFVVTYKTREPGALILHKLVALGDDRRIVGGDTLVNYISRLRKDMRSIDLFSNEMYNL
jgi:hypothetical protein